MSLKNIKKQDLSFFISYTLLLSLFFLACVKIGAPDSYTQLSIFNAYIALTAHCIIIFYTIKLYLNAPKDEQKILLWLAGINIGLFLDDLSFFILVYLHGHTLDFFNSKFLIYLLDFIPSLIWIFSSIVFLSKILLSSVLSPKKLFKVLFPFLLLNSMIIYLFLSSTHYVYPLLSWQNTIRIPFIGLYFIILDLAILGLIYSKQKGLSFFFTGLAVLICGNIFIVYASISQAHSVLNYGELLWTLGLIFMLLGILTMTKTKGYRLKNWYNETNTMKVKLTFWTFSASITGFLLFSIIAFSLSILDKSAFLGLPLFIIIYSIVIVVLSIYIGNCFAAPFKKIENNIRVLMLEEDKTKIDDSFSTQEFRFLQKFIVEAFELKEEKNIAQKKLTTLAAQVAHDIRSPLAALNTCLRHLPQIPENQRILMRNVANRINDIANNLLHQYRSGENEVSENLHVWLLAPLVENIVSEKRLQFEGQHIHLEEKISNTGFSTFSKFEPKEMKRLLSNLINNAAEAFHIPGGEITLTLDTRDESICLQIKDNGCGIPAEKLSEVLKMGVSFKKNGSGLGLSYAKRAIESWGGTLQLHSIVGQGTTVDIQLPETIPPSWFTSEIIISPHVPIGILDDDQSVHDAWDQRLLAVANNLNIYHFKTPQSFSEWYETKPGPIQVFSDYELLGEAETGLDVLEKLEIGSNGILVTSHYEDATIIQRCQSSHIRLLPKNLLAHIKIELSKELMPAHHDLVFIDDDATLCKCWQISANFNGKSIMTFTSIAAFEKTLPNINNTTPIYIDSELGRGIRGEDYAKQLFDQGFHEIYLVTGHTAASFGPMPWIRAITDKNPPFL